MKIEYNFFKDLCTLILIGVGSIIGSGWLFAAYYASKDAGPASIISWIIGAILTLLMALLLAEIASFYPLTGLFGRLMVLSHNKDIGFVFAASNLISIIILIPLEAESTVQYISTVFPRLTDYLFQNSEFTWIGTLIVSIFIIFYITANFWGLKSLSKVNNSITIIKIVVPIMTAIIIICMAFANTRFIGHQETFMPYGYGSIFSAIINCGILYSFFGFPAIAAFSSETKWAKRLIPLALILCISICLFIYLMLQIAFIGAVPENMLTNGWAAIDFTSPLAQLAGLLGLHVLMIVLYADACLSPSGTGIIYLGSGTRFLTAMSQDGHIPSYFGYIHSKYLFSRRALISISIFCLCLIWFFKNWKSIVILITVAQILACLGIPLAFYRLRKYHLHLKRLFRMRFGLSLSLFIYLLLTYLIVIAEFKAVITTFLLEIILFAVYAAISNKGNIRRQFRTWFSAWSMFIYMIVICLISFCFNKISHKILYSHGGFLLFLVISTTLFYFIAHQKDYNTDKKTIQSL